MPLIQTAPNQPPFGQTAAQAERIALARTAIARAATLAREYFDHLDQLKVEVKSGPQDPVSQADRGVEDLLRGEIAAAFPQDAILGEERGMEPGSTGWTWVIDPIDGTTPFLHGLPSWTVVIALLQGDVTRAGLIAEPCRDRLYVAEREGGAWLEQPGAPRQRLAVCPAPDLAGQIVACGPGSPVHAARIGRIVTRIISAEASFMRNGSAALSLAQVAAGHYAAFHEPELSAWDCLAGQLLVEEAGGRSAPFDMSAPTTRQPVTCAAPAIYETVAEMMAG